MIYNVLSRGAGPRLHRPLTAGPRFELKDAVDYTGSLHPELKIPDASSTGRARSVADAEPTLGGWT